MILLEFESRIISETLSSRFEQIGGEKVGKGVWRGRKTDRKRD
jgi:hypothetical protein